MLRSFVSTKLSPTNHIAVLKFRSLALVPKPTSRFTKYNPVINSHILRRSFFSRKVNPEGKAVFITGCDTGFGHTAALRLHDYGFHVYSACLVPELNGGRALRKLEKSGRMKVLQCDVTKWKEIRACAQFITNDLSKNNLELWAVMPNAGVATFSEFEWIPMEDYENMMNVNCMGTVRTVKAFLPLLRESQGRLLIMSSLGGRYAIPGFSVYCMTKYAQIGLADGLRRELRKFGIEVATIEPGAYRSTDLADNKALVRTLDRHWIGLPSAIQKAYGDKYFSALRAHIPQVAARGSDKLQEPVNSIMEAFTAPRVRGRYLAGSIPTLLRAKFMPLFPVSLQDWILRNLSIGLPSQRLKRPKP